MSQIRPLFTDRSGHGAVIAWDNPGKAKMRVLERSPQMEAATGETLDKLEDMIVRTAETTAAHVRAAKAAIGTVIFGQDKVIDHALITILSGGHGLLVGVPGL